MLITTCEYVAAGVQASGGNQDVWHHPDVQFLGTIPKDNLHNTCCQHNACLLVFAHEANSMQCELDRGGVTARAQSLACNETSLLSN
jgi:hypothetical protein